MMSRRFANIMRVPAPRRFEAMVRLPYRNRAAAGWELAQRLLGYLGLDPLVLALPRGGAVAAQVAAKSNADLDVQLVRKLGLPRQSELAMGGMAQLPGTQPTGSFPEQSGP